jgi:hypothetical protein
MNAARFIYRTRQFWQALNPTPAVEDLELVQSILTPAQLALFKRLQASEQAHSLRAWRALRAQGESNPDLQVAALLHDVGKSRFPLKIGERILIVLVKAFCPGCAKRWGAGPAAGWRRAFVIAAQHPAWGADLAAAAGVSDRAAALIRRHQETFSTAEGVSSTLEERLLRKLQAVDDES